MYVNLTGSQKRRQRETLELDKEWFRSFGKRISRLLALHETAVLEKYPGIPNAEVFSTCASLSGLRTLG